MAQTVSSLGHVSALLLLLKRFEYVEIRKVCPPSCTGLRDSHDPGPIDQPVSTTQRQFASLISYVPSAFRVTIGLHGALMQSAYFSLQNVSGSAASAITGSARRKQAAAIRLFNIWRALYLERRSFLPP